MADAYECQNCGAVVERLRNCPSCGENAMRPTRMPESDAQGGPETDGTAPADTAERSSKPTETASGGSEPTANGSEADEHPAADNGRTDPGRGEDEGGCLLTWLRSLF